MVLGTESGHQSATINFDRMPCPKPRNGEAVQTKRDERSLIALVLYKHM